MNHLIRKIFFALLLFFIAAHSYAGVRILPDEITTETLKISFNGETLKGLYSLTDARTDEEKKADLARKETAGAVIILLNGHAQRPIDANNLINSLAVKSKSGIVVTPVCDTPYGKNNLWHGDNGKDIVLMEMVRHILSTIDISVKHYVPLSVNDAKARQAESFLSEGTISTEVITIGWSHGGLLARRLASAYPESVVGMGQVCPAGYNDWMAGPGTLAVSFTGESFNIGRLLFTKNAPDALRAGYGFTSGIAEDFLRGTVSSITELRPLKLFRPVKDIIDCSLYADGSNFPVTGIRNGVVIFALNDTVMDTKQTGVNSEEQPTAEENRRFWEKFYPGLDTQKGHFSLNFLKGNHLAPIVFHDLYSTVLLEGLQEIKNRNSSL